MGQVIPSRKYLLSWLTLFRLGATARGVLPFLLGAVIAWSQGKPIDLMVLLLATIAVLCIMLMTFLVNEYYDYDTDKANADYHMLSGGSRILTRGLIPRRHAIIAAGFFLSVAIIIGLILYFYFRTGPLTIPLGAIAIIIGYFYTAKPLQLSYRGLGEIGIWFTCGWLATVTGYYLQVGQFNAVATLASLPGAISVFLVILVNEIPDIRSDKLSGKNTLAVRLGLEKTGTLYIALLILCYVNIIAVIFFGVPVISAYLSVILLPFIILNVLTVVRKGLAGKALQESLSLKTMVFDHLITTIYVVSFIVAGLGLTEARIDRLIVLVVFFVVIFGLEGLGIASSRKVLAD